VYSQVLQNVLKRLDLAFQNFFRRVKNNQTPGFPKYKKKGTWDSITYPKYSKTPLNDTITAPKIGIVKIIYHRDMPKEANIKTLTIAKEANNKWFACFSVELEYKVPIQELKRAIGIDLGLIEFLYVSDGSHIKAPKYFRKHQNRIKQLQRRFAKAERYKPKWYKLLHAIQKVYFRIRCLKHDFLHKTANWSLEKADVIFHEDLNIAGMIRRPKSKQDENGKYLPNNACAKSGLNKSIADASWGQFLSILKHKAATLGKMVIGVNPRYTSQECPECHQIVKKSLSVRTHKCPFCNFTANRDLAAALNILRIGMDTLANSNIELLIA